MSVRDAYLAGLIDGDGCISIEMCKGRSLRPSVQIHMTKAEDLLQEIRREYGGYVCPHKPGSSGRQMSWCWRVTGPLSVPVLLKVQPFLRLKREQAVLAFELQTLKEAAGIKSGRGWRFIGDGLVRATEIAVECKRLNQVGAR